jgi:uncharacterized lipoprotein YddW (UPF0748 family)
LALALAVASSSPAEPPKPPKPQIRALWVDGFHAGIRTREETDKLVADAQAARLNLLIVQVRRRGDSYYLNSLEPPVEDPPYDPAFDALGYLLEKAHAAGLKVHCWMNVTPIWRSNQSPPKDPKHVFNLHGPSATGRDNWLMSTATGEIELPTGYSLDPGHPDAARHIAETMINLVKRYPAVDGVHLDYVRYAELIGATEEAGAGVGYNPVSVERFHKRTGAKDKPAANDPRWADWRREQITNIVRRIYLGVKQANPKVELSAALIPWGDGPADGGAWPHAHPYWRIFQDWQLWLRTGLLDVAVPMNYDRQSDPRTSAYYLHWIEFEKNNKHGQRLAIGLGAYLNSEKDNVEQLRLAQTRSRRGKFSDGFSVYSYGNNGGLLAKLPELLKEPAAYPAPEPPRTGNISGVAPQTDGAIVEIARKGTFGWGGAKHVLTDGNGFFGLTQLKPGLYRVTAKGVVRQTAVEAGRVSHVDF